MCLILKGYEIELFDSPDLTTLDFCLLVKTKREVYKRKVGTRDESLVRIFGCCHPYKQTWNTVQTKNTRSSHASGELH